MRTRFSFLPLAGLFLIATYTYSADFNNAYADYESGDYKQAYRGFKSLAHNDNAEAQYLLGLLYLNGQGVKQATERGLNWLQRSAENGYYLAAAELGQVYISGKGVAIDSVEAAKWIELSTALAEEEDADEECD